MYLGKNISAIVKAKKDLADGSGPDKNECDHD
jgi:hypothetical protein